MAEDTGNKSEQPTPKKIRDARKKGNVAFSKDIPIIGVTTAVVIFIYLMSDFVIQLINESMLLSYAYFDLPIRNSLAILMDKAIEIAIYFVLPLCFIVFITAIAATVAHIGFIFSTEKFKFDFNNINPVNGFKKIFSKKTLVETLKVVIVVSILAYSCYLVIMADFKLILNSINYSVEAIFAVAKQIIFNLLIICFIIYIIVSVIDYIIQRSFYIKQLMMSHDEIKKESKETEGDPLIKSKRKEIHREIIDGEFIKNVSDSNVVISNPTRVAVGVAFHVQTVPIPFVTIKGIGYKANVIMHIAHQYDVPIVESKYLARDLYKQTDPGQFIPKMLFRAVAEILAPLTAETKVSDTKSHEDKAQDIDDI